MRILLTIIFGLFAYVASSQTLIKSDMKAVELLDLNKYAGVWYEIYRLPMRAEKDLVNVTATYKLRNDGRIDVLNQGYKHSPEGKHKKAKAIAWRPNDDFPGELFVRFFRLFKSTYHVVALDENYNWAIVSTKSRQYAWILSRNPILDAELEKELLSMASQKGIDTTRFFKTPQQW